MKLIISLFSIFIFTQQCNNNTEKQETNSNFQDAIEITYEAQSRGFYQKIILNKKQITVQKNRSEDSVVTKECSKEDWNEIIKLLDTIDTEELRKNYVNADDLGRDAVIPATLYINYKENIVANLTLAHGNAPEVLRPLLTKIDTMANAVDKP